jgi:hypothetical protein
MNNSKKSLVVRDEVINLIKEKFEVKFNFGYNDLYKVKDNFIVRRLKGSLSGEKLNKYCSSEDISYNKELINERNEFFKEIDNFISKLNYKDFEIRLKKKLVSGINLEGVRKRNSFLEFSSIKEILEYYNKINNELILSIKFKNI